MQLDQMALFHQQAFVAGQWCNADNQNTSNISLYTTNFTEPLSYHASAFLKLPKFP